MKKPRWNHAPCFVGNELLEFWTSRLTQKKDLLIIMGVGFDPRMNTIAKIIKSSRGDGKRDIKLIEYRREASTVSHNIKFTQENIKEFTSLTKDWGVVETIPFFTLDANGNFIGDYEAQKIGQQIIANLEGYSEVIIDLGALPTYVAYPIIERLIHAVDGAAKVNLHVSTGVAQVLDDKIQETPQEVRYLAGFQSNLENKGLGTLPKIWVPVLGPGREQALKLLYNFILPRDICPVLPFPSQDPRRPDNIVAKYRELLFEAWEIQPGPSDIFYASELGPLDVYRRIVRLHNHYQKVLEPLCEGMGSTRTVVSPLCSKLLSIGVLLAAIDQKSHGLGVAHAFGGGHSALDDSTYYSISREDNFALQQSVWIAGEPYL